MVPKIKKKRRKEENILELKKPWYKMKRACLSAKWSKLKRSHIKSSNFNAHKSKISQHKGKILKYRREENTKCYL